MKILIILVIGLLLSIGNLSALELSLSTADTAPYTNAEGSGFYDILLKEVFNEMGIDIQISHLLSMRSIQNADDGISNGEFARIEGMSSDYKNLRIVPEALVTFNFTVFSRDPGIIISSWEQLSEYNVAYIDGWKIFQNNVPATTNVTKVKDVDSLFKMLIYNRVDLILYSKLRGLSKIGKEGIKNFYISDPPLSSRGMYLYMHSKYEYIIPDIASGLRSVKESGRYLELMDKYLVFK